MQHKDPKREPMCMEANSLIVIRQPVVDNFLNFFDVYEFEIPSQAIAGDTPSAAVT